MDIKLTNDHDIGIVSNDFTLTETESESLKQRLIIKLLTFQGEWFLNQNEGLPYYQSILGKNRAKETIDTIFKTAILDTPDVISLDSFQSSIDNLTRGYTMSFRVRSNNADEPIPIKLTI